MEDVLEVYQRPVDPMRPLFCVDEFAKQLLPETRTPLPATSQHPARHDYEYVREGSISGFMIATPHLGQREVYVGEEGRRTAIDFAKCMDHLANEVHPEAEKITVAMDNLKTGSVISTHNVNLFKKIQCVHYKKRGHHDVDMSYRERLKSKGVFCSPALSSKTDPAYALHRASMHAKIHRQ